MSEERINEGNPPSYFRGLWIPEWLYYHQELSLFEKMLWARIHTLCSKRQYCWATNAYLAKDLNCSADSVSKGVSHLGKAGLLHVELFQDLEVREAGRLGSRRHIWTITPNEPNTPPPKPKRIPKWMEFDPDAPEFRPRGVGKKSDHPSEKNPTKYQSTETEPLASTGTALENATLVRKSKAPGDLSQAEDVPSSAPPPQGSALAPAPEPRGGGDSEAVPTGQGAALFAEALSARLARGVKSQTGKALYSGRETRATIEKRKREGDLVAAASKGDVPYLMRTPGGQQP
jgi:Helix-turn-helix domain